MIGASVSKDYGPIAELYRPGHADFTYDQKYGFRDYRGGGRSSGRETAGRVAAGAIAIKLLNELVKLESSAKLTCVNAIAIFKNVKNGPKPVKSVGIV